MPSMTLRSMNVDPSSLLLRAIHIPVNRFIPVGEDVSAYDTVK